GLASLLFAVDHTICFFKIASDSRLVIWINAHAALEVSDDAGRMRRHMWNPTHPTPVVTIGGVISLRNSATVGDPPRELEHKVLACRDKQRWCHARQAESRNQLIEVLRCKAVTFASIAIRKTGFNWMCRPAFREMPAAAVVH